VKVASEHDLHDVYCDVRAGRIDTSFVAITHYLKLSEIISPKSTSSKRVYGGTLRSATGTSGAARSCTAEWYRHRDRVTVGVLAKRSGHRVTNCAAVLTKLVPTMIDHLADYPASR
jgi:hypothetical protein